MMNGKIFDYDNPVFAKTLATVVSGTFEKMAFTSVRAVPNQELEDNLLCSVISVESPLPGRMYLLALKDDLWRIATTIYGQEDTDDELVADMINELVNTLVGSLLTVLMPDKQFCLTVPQITFPEDAEQGSDIRFHYELADSGTVIVGLRNL